MSSIKKSKYRKFVSLKGFAFKKDENKGRRIDSEEAKKTFEKVDRPIKEKPEMQYDESDVVDINELLEDEVNITEEVSITEEDLKDIEEADMANEEVMKEDFEKEFEENKEEEKEEVREEKVVVKKPKKKARVKKVKEVLPDENGYYNVSGLLQFIEDKNDKKEFNPALISLEAREKKKGKGITKEMLMVLVNISTEAHNEHGDKWANKASWLREFAKRRKARSPVEDASLDDEKGIRKEFVKNS